MRRFRQLICTLIGCSFTQMLTWLDEGSPETIIICERCRRAKFA